MFKERTWRNDIADFIAFIRLYIVAKWNGVSSLFEMAKDTIVAFLIAKRGKYQQSFLHTSFLLLVVALWIAGPIIAEQNPLMGRNINQTPDTGSSIVSAYAQAGSEASTYTRISQKPRDQVEIYTVQGGDTLSEIAKKFDISVDSLKWANDNKDDTIKPGQKLNIPPVNGIVHKVKSGDTIFSIAKYYNTDAQKIVNYPFNEFADPDTFSLIPGQLLIVPDGSPHKEEAPVYRPLTPQFMAGQQGSGSFIWPTSGMVTQYPVWYHMALDIANPSMPPVLAADSGTVSYAGCIGWGYGCHIIIDHANGYQSLYGHLSSIGVSVGQGVGKGQQIGVMGSTGRSTGTHLHFEIRQNGALLNPLGFLQ